MEWKTNIENMEIFTHKIHGYYENFVEFFITQT